MNRTPYPDESRTSEAWAFLAVVTWFSGSLRLDMLLSVRTD